MVISSFFSLQLTLYVVKLFFILEIRQLGLSLDKDLMVLFSYPTNIKREFFWVIPTDPFTVWELQNP